MPTNIKSFTSLPIYAHVKNYFVFYFPDGISYYLSEEIEKLFFLIKEKKNNPMFIDWIKFLQKIKQAYPEWVVNDMISNKPSYTANILVKPQNEKVKSLNLYISISLIAPFYIILIEEILNDETRFIYVSPQGKYTDIFKFSESLIEETFPHYTFLCSNFYDASFFNLMVPGLNSLKPDEMLPSPRITILQGLFFNFDLDIKGFGSIVGDGNYKRDPYFSIAYDPDKVIERRQLLMNNDVTYQTIEPHP